MSVALIYPTHKNIQEELDRYEAADFNAAAFPVRTTVDTDLTSQNCWNDEANQVEAIGLPVVKTICNTCQHRISCKVVGYLGQTIEARGADVCLATHKRTAVTGFTELTQGRDYVSVHEDPLEILRPTLMLKPQGLDEVCQLIERLLTDPTYLNWYSDGQRRDGEGNVFHDPEQVVRRERIYEALVVLDRLLQNLSQTIEQATEPKPWQPPEVMDSPAGFESFLWWAIRTSKLRFTESPWQFVLAAFNGRLEEVMVLVTEHHVKGLPQGVTQTHKECVGVIHNNPPAGCVVWINDATADREFLENLIGTQIHDQTPEGMIPTLHQAQQYVRDITRKTSKKRLQAYVRGLLCKYRNKQRIGLITHSNHLSAIEQLEGEFLSRIVKMTYFGSGDERSSNAWHTDCDLILVLGTPRVPPNTVMTLLTQVGQSEAACIIPKWDVIHWYGHTTAGVEKKFEGRGYYDKTWMRAHQSLVRASLVQAVGRGRGILENGCDVIVLSSDECGLKVIDEPVPALGHQLLEFYEQVRNLTAINSKIYIIEKYAVSTGDVAKSLQMPERTTRLLLSQLEELGLVHRDGPRSGWKLGPNPSVSHSHTIDSIDSENRHLNNQSPPSERNL